MSGSERNQIIYRTFAEIPSTTDGLDEGLIAIFQEGVTRGISLPNLFKKYYTKPEVDALDQGLQDNLDNSFALISATTNGLNSRITGLETDSVNISQPQTITGEKSFSSNIVLDNAARLAFTDGTSRRWNILRDSSDGALKTYRYNDSGNFQDVISEVDSITGTTTFNKDVIIEAKLKVDGLQDTRSTVLDIRDFGAIGDDSTDNLAAIQAAIDACDDGGEVFIPAGVFRVSDELVINKRVTVRGVHSPRWPYQPAIGVEPCQLKPHASFTASQMVRITGGSSADGVRFDNFALNANSKGTNVTGVLIEGLIRDIEFTKFSVSQTSGVGIETRKLAGVNPRGLKFDRVTVHSAGNTGTPRTGFLLDTPTDSSFSDCLAVACEGDGWQISNPGDTKLIGCRSVFNKERGYNFIGSPTVGGIQLLGCGTDRNYGVGLRIAATGNQPIQIIGFEARRDGGSDNLPGILLDGTELDPVCPVQIIGLEQTLGQDDPVGGNPAAGAITPATGLEITHVSSLQVSGVCHGRVLGLDFQGVVGSVNISQLKSLIGSSDIVETDWGRFNTNLTLSNGVTFPEGSRVELQNSGTRATVVEQENGLSIKRYDTSGNFLDTPVRISDTSGSLNVTRDFFHTGGQLDTTGVIKSRKSLEIRDVSNPPSNPLDGVSLYSQNGEFFIKDSSGNSLNLTQTATTVVSGVQIPVGYIVTNDTGVNPAAELGYGTWEKFGEGRALVGQLDADPNFGSLGVTGGAAEHTLTIAEMPTHNHDVIDPGHNHRVQETFVQTNNGDYGSAGNDDVDRETRDSSSETTGITIDNQGSSQPHNNLQPYIVVVHWKRTA